MRLYRSARKHAPRLLLTLAALVGLSVSVFAPAVSADSASYTATQIHDWLVDTISGATVVITDATSVLLESAGSESPYMRVDGISLNVLGVTVGLDPIKFTFDSTTDVAILAELDLFGISPAPKVGCTATVGCVGPGGTLEITSIDAASVKVGSFEPTLTPDDINAIIDVVNQIIVASDLTVTAPDASLTGITVIDDGDADDLQLSWSDDDHTYLGEDELEDKINGMAGTLEAKATNYLQAGEGDWTVDVTIAADTHLQLVASLTAFEVTATLDATVVFDTLTATITDATFTIGDDPKTVTFSAETLVGCSNYIPYIEMQSFELGDEFPDLSDYVAQVEETILSSIDDAVDAIVEDIELDLPCSTIESIAVVGENVVLTEGAYLIVGDVNLDESTNIIDAMFIAQYVVGLRSLDADQLRCADTTADSAVNIIDAMHIAQFTVDPRQIAGILFKPLYDPVFHQGMIDPLTLT